MRKRIIKLAIFTILILLLVAASSKVLERKNGLLSKEEFYTNKNGYEYDVLFLGTSHMLYGVYPLNMWMETGITSYNLGGYAQRIPTSYWILKNALDYSTPELVVLDVYGIQADDMYSTESVEFMHFAFDAIPFTKNKVDAVFHLLNSWDERLEFLFDFYIYHSRWIEANRWDLDYSNTPGTMGAMIDRTAGHYECPKLNDISKVNETETMGRVYLRKIIEMCQERQIDILLVNIPWTADTGALEYSNSVYRIAEKYEIPYYDMQRDQEIQMDYACDFTESNGQHLNYEGAGKVTSALAGYILKNYQIAARTGGIYEKWRDNYNYYVNQ